MKFRRKTVTLEFDRPLPALIVGATDTSGSRNAIPLLASG
jgi:hypothetical protein